MIDIITYTLTISVDIIEHANVLIQDVTVPDVVEASEDFIVSYSAFNEGNIDDCYGRIIDTDTNGEIVGSYWTQTLGTSANRVCSVTIPGKSTTYNLKIEVGYQK